VEPVAPQQPAETSKPATDTAQSTPPKVDYATDLFNMLSMDDQNENGSKAAGATADDINWAGFQCMSVSLKKKHALHWHNNILLDILFWRIWRCLCCEELGPVYFENTLCFHFFYLLLISKLSLYFQPIFCFQIFMQKTLNRKGKKKPVFSVSIQIFKNMKQIESSATIL
jgi:hypothetical protein